ncbi:MAG: hypothetical protein M5R36_18475 [Deltaproteobacteria bacterium]|nr:hypothetical protein [Deltaproteobacteria bacterium]
MDSEGWTTLAAYTDRVYSCVLEDGPDHTLILGGGDYDGVTPYPTTDEILSFNSNDDSWTVATGTLPYTRAGMACVQDDEGNVYMFSGYSTDAGKDEKTGARLHLFRANVVLLLALIVVANYIYLIYHGPFSQLKATVRTSGNDTPQDAPMEDGGNGTARVPLPNDAAAGPAKITIQNTETGRADTRPFTIENGSANDWTFNDNFGYSAYMGTYMLPPGRLRHAANGARDDRPVDGGGRRRGVSVFAQVPRDVQRPGKRRERRLRDGAFRSERRGGRTVFRAAVSVPEPRGDGDLRSVVRGRRRPAFRAVRRSRGDAARGAVRRHDGRATQRGR